MYYDLHINPPRKTLVAFWERVQKTGEYQYDTETAGLDCYADSILMHQFGVDDGDKPMVIVIFDYAIKSDNGKIKNSIYLNFIKSLSEATNLITIGHNLKFDFKMLYAQYGIHIRNMYDTMLGESVTRNGHNESVSLAATLVRRLGVEVDKSTRNQFIGKPRDYSFTREQIEYGAEDVTNLSEIKRQQIREAINEGLLPTLELENSIIAVIALMELNGFYVDTDRINRAIDSEGKLALDQLKYLYTTLKSKVKLQPIRRTFVSRIQSDINTYALVLNINSPQAKVEYLHKMGIYPEKDEKPTSAAAQLQAERTKFKLQQFEGDDSEELQGKIEFLDSLLSYNKQFKFLSSYLWKILKEIHPITGRYHPTYHQLRVFGNKQGGDGGTVSGRLSGSFQTSPQNNEFRNSFIYIKGWKVITIDYSGMELRILANKSGDEALIKTFKDPDYDIHGHTGSIVFKKELDIILSYIRKEIDRKELAYQLENAEVTVWDKTSERVGDLIDRVDKYASKYDISETYHLSAKVKWEPDWKDGYCIVKQVRNYSKTLMYGASYGATGARFSDAVDVSLARGIEMEELLYSAYPKAFAYLNEIADESVKLGYASDYTLGRKRYFPKAEADWEIERQRRVAKNMFPQGTNAAVTKIALFKIYDYIMENDLQDVWHILGSVHDEIICAFPEEYVEVFRPLQAQFMIDAANEVLSGEVPYTVGIATEDSWTK